MDRSDSTTIMDTDKYEKTDTKDVERAGENTDTVVALEGGVLLNASGYKDQLTRQYGLMRLTGVAITVNNAWVVLGSSISLAILNGGPPGIIYGLLVAAFYYAFIGMSLAELASSVPTSGGVYHWATIAAGERWGRLTGFFTGWINFFAWMFNLAALVQIAANAVVQMYAVYQPDYTIESWHIYIAYLGVVWISTLIVVFANRLVPLTQQIGMLLVVAGGIVTVIVISAMPSQHASDEFVWKSMEENNLTGWQVGVAFILGVLNGAFTLGTADAVTHMAEEVSNPSRDLPRAIALQISVGGIYAFCFAIALGYAISDMSVLQESSDVFPLATIYRQATGSVGGTFGLLFIIFLSITCGCIGTVLTNSRIYWALARDNAVPFSKVFGRVNESLSCPVESALLVAVMASGLGAIPMGSTEGFSNLTGSFIILSTVSYAVPFAANLITKRKHFSPGVFHLGRYGTSNLFEGGLFLATDLRPEIRSTASQLSVNVIAVRFDDVGSRGGANSIKQLSSTIGNLVALAARGWWFRSRSSSACAAAAATTKQRSEVIFGIFNAVTNTIVSAGEQRVECTALSGKLTGGQARGRRDNRRSQHESYGNRDELQGGSHCSFLHKLVCNADLCS
ncbi:LOW QUALITY PROTEIN: putative amino acid transporter [Paramyrothecium foliicola]|nr:LOW QUALITY PROTEIN: putative amino acid transporter [Paramyrothecium foliicola]